MVEVMDMVSELVGPKCDIRVDQERQTEGRAPRAQGAQGACAADHRPPARSSVPLGIALGGGAARGLSHIGVLKTLASHGVTFPIITGTSMGAIIGAAYACGKLYEIEAVARSTTPITMSGWIDMNPRTGALKGEAVKEVFRQFVGDTTFADLRDRGISFAVVAADLDKEEPVYISEGRVDDAVRASMSLPGVFEPVSMDGRVLVDGGLIDNVPVDVARSLGAWIVVGVEVLNTYDVWTRAALRVGLSVVQLREMRAHLRQMANEQRARASRGLPNGASDSAGLSAGLPLGVEPEKGGSPRDFTIPALSRFRWSDGFGGLARTSDLAPAKNRTSLKTTLDALDIIASILEDGRQPFRANSRADVFIRPDVSKYHAHQFYRASQLIALGERAAREALPNVMALAAGQLGRWSR